MGILPPLVKVPVLKSEVQFSSTMNFEFYENILQMGFNRFRRDAQGFRNLVISTTKAGQRGNLLFTVGQRIPTFFEIIFHPKLIQARLRKISNDFLF